MGMTIEEIIAKEQELSKIFQKTVDTHMVREDFSLEELYCDDTEMIEEELQRCKELADFHNQIANIMQKYQKIKELYDNCSFVTDKSVENFIGNIAEILDDDL
jgi:hypothetical protein